LSQSRPAQIAGGSARLTALPATGRLKRGIIPLGAAGALFRATVGFLQISSPTGHLLEDLADRFTMAKGAIFGVETAAIAVVVLLILQRYKVNPALLVVGGAVLGVFSFMPK